MKFKKIILILILVIILTAIIVLGIKFSNKNTKSTAKYTVTVSNFASYDFLRAIIGDNKDIQLNFLLGPGKDSHSYEPTAQDLIKIQDSNLFVYIGGEMEAWHDKVLDSLETGDTKIICIADDIDTIDEKEVDGAEEEEEEHDHDHEEGAFDEHIWTSPKNAIIMINTLEKALEEIDSENAETYRKNAEAYIAKINEVDEKIQEIVDNKKRDRLVFGDKMPMQYFIDYYGLEVSAAFNGCSTETEPSSKTITYLVDKAKEENIPVILYIELNTGKVAEVIADEVGENCRAMQIQTLHNVSKKDFDNGETYVSLMERNINVLKSALN